MTTETTPAADSAAQPYRWAMLFGTWLIYFSFGLTASVLATLVVPIETDLGLSHSAMGSVFGAWTLVFIFSAMPCGALMDRIGPRRSLFLAALFIAASGMLRGTAEGFASLFFAVGVFGIGGPLVAIGSPKVISLWFEGKDRAVAMGIYITGPSLGSVAGLSLTNSYIMPLFDDAWRHVLFAYAAFALCCGLIWLVISAHPASREMERRVAAQPRVSQLKVFADLIHVRAVQVMLLMAVGIFFFNHSLNNWLPELLRHSGMDEATAGFWAAVPTAVGVVGALIIPRFATPERRIRVLVLLFLSAAGSTLLLHSDPGLALGTALIFQGLAKSSMMTLALLTVMEIPEVGARHTGSAGGLFFSAAEVGGVLGPLTLGFTYDSTGGFDLGLNILTMDCLVLMVLALVLSRLNRGNP